VTGEVIEIPKGQGRMETPRDPVSNQTLGIRFNSDDLVKSGAYHHHEHPRFLDEYGIAKDMDVVPADEIDIGALLRMSVVTWAPHEYHFDGSPNGYHLAFSGAKPITSPMKKFVTGGLGLTGTRSTKAIDMTRFEGDRIAVVRTLKRREFELMTDPRVTHLEGNSPIPQARTRRWAGHAIINYALNRDLTEVIKPQKINKYLSAYGRQPGRTARTGRQIINQAVLHAVHTELMPAYDLAKQEGMVPERGWPSPEAAVMNILPHDEFHLHHKQLQTILKGIKPALQTEVKRVELPVAA